MFGDCSLKQLLSIVLALRTTKTLLTQLKKVYEDGQTKNPNIKIKASDKYLVLSTCREEDETIRSNLYLRQIPDSEMKDFVAKHADQLKYVATRGQQ